MKHLLLCYSLSCSHTSTLSWRCGICNFSYLYFYCNLYYRPVFSWESKPKLVESHPSDQSEHKPMRTQSENMSNKLPEVQESAIAFCLASDWLRRWDKFSGPIKVQSTILESFFHFVENCSIETRWCVLHHEIQIMFSLRLNICWTLLSFSLSCMWSVDCLLGSWINNGLVHVLN